MKKIFGTMIAVVLLGMAIGCTRVEQDEQAFKYNVLSGKPVSSEENKLLPFGWTDMFFAWHTKLFRVTTQSQQFTFSEVKGEESPFDEALRFDSIEGATIQTRVTIIARVIDAWKFYDNYGVSQYAIPKESKAISDSRLYEAIREAGAYVAIRLPEITSKMPMVEIRRKLGQLNDQLSKETTIYMEQFGVKVDQVILAGDLKFPTGDEMEKANNRLGDMNAKIEKAERELETAEKKKTLAIEQASVAQQQIISQTNREAERLIAEAEAMVGDMKTSVNQIGKDATTDLFINREFVRLVEGGNVPHSYLSEKSLTAPSVK